MSGREGLRAELRLAAFAGGGDEVQLRRPSAARLASMSYRRALAEADELLTQGEAAAAV